LVLILFFISTTNAGQTTPTPTIDTIKWHELPKEVQGRYYEKAKVEREIHQYNHPYWSAKDNYARSRKLKKQKLQLQNEPKECNVETDTMSCDPKGLAIDVHGFDRRRPWFDSAQSLF
jgi:hypothetical protein